MSDDSLDELDAILTPKQSAESPALHDAIRVRTERVIRNRRRVRLAARVGAMVVLFASGVSAGVHSQPDRDPAHDFRFMLHEEAKVIVVPLLIPIPGNEPGRTEPGESIPAPRLEVQAEQTENRGEAAKLYRLAGDRYVDEHDYRNAARCYRMYLARAGEPALQPDARDTWLLTSLKNAAFQEKFNVAKTDG